MMKIRIGKDILVTWHILSHGGKVDLKDKDLRVEIDSPKCKAFTDFTVVDNSIGFTYYGIDQHHLGKYTLTLWSNYGLKGQSVLDKVMAFELVSSTELETELEDDTLDVVTLDITSEVTEHGDIILKNYYTKDETDSLLYETKNDAIAYTDERVNALSNTEYEHYTELKAKNSVQDREIGKNAESIQSIISNYATRDLLNSELAKKVDEAPKDNKQYVRKDGEWVENDFSKHFFYSGLYLDEDDDEVKGYADAAIGEAHHALINGKTIIINCSSNNNHPIVTNACYNGSSATFSFVHLNKSYIVTIDPSDNITTHCTPIIEDVNKDKTNYIRYNGEWKRLEYIVNASQLDFKQCNQRALDAIKQLRTDVPSSNIYVPFGNDCLAPFCVHAWGSTFEAHFEMTDAKYVLITCNPSNTEMTYIEKEIATTSYVNDTEERLHIDINKKQDKLVSGTNIKTINGESILGEGDIEVASESAFDVTSIATGYNAAMKSANPNTVLDTARGQFICGWNNQSKNGGSFTCGNGNINGANNGVVMGAGNKVNEDALASNGVCSTIIGRNNTIVSDPNFKGNYDFIQGYGNTLKTKGINFIGGINTYVEGSYNKVLGSDGAYVVGDRNTTTYGSNQFLVIENWSKESDGVYLVPAPLSSIARNALIKKFPIYNNNTTTGNVKTTDYTIEIVDDNTLRLKTTALTFTQYMLLLNNTTISNDSFNCGGFVGSNRFGYAIGHQASTFGQDNYSFGHSTITTNNYEVALGFYNKSTTDTLLSVGYGSNDTNRSNAFEIKKNGDVILKDGTCIQDKFNEIELSKVPNVTIFGTPTIQNGQVSSFSTINYLQFPFLVDLTNKSFEINMCFTTSNDVTAQQNIFDSNFGLAFAIKNGSFIAAISSNGTSWDSGELEGYSVVLPNTTYYYKIKGIYEEGYTMYQFLVSEDNITFTEDMEMISMASPYPRHITIGKSVDNTHIFNGSINLNNCNVIVNDIELWRGMDSVGLATRLATDLSNIDASGMDKINTMIDEKLGDIESLLSNI